eukprot:6241698-Pyramimonas_sp.AAC.1
MMTYKSWAQVGRTGDNSHWTGVSADGTAVPLHVSKFDVSFVIPGQRKMRSGFGASVFWLLHS